MPVDSVQLTLSFWPTGADGELDSIEVRGIGREAVAPGAASEPILVRSTVGYTTEQAPRRRSSPTASSRTGSSRSSPSAAARSFRSASSRSTAASFRSPHPAARERLSAASSAAVSRSGDACAAPRPARRGRHRHLQRHRRRHLLRPGPRRAAHTLGMGHVGRLAVRRDPRVCGRHGLCGAGDAPPARRRRVRLSARGVRRRSRRFSPAGRRLLRDSPARLPPAPSRSPTTSAASSRPPPTVRRSLTLPLPLRPARRHAPVACGDSRDRGLIADPSARVRPARAQLARRASRCRRSLVFIAIGAVSWGRATFGHFASVQAVAVPARTGCSRSIPVMFSYSGWNAAAYVAEEIRDPSRNVPRALACGHPRRSLPSISR